MTTDTMAYHWYWRPGWQEGRTFYTWHLTFQHQTALHEAADAYRQALADITTLDLVPDRWLHLTMQGLGFTDEVDAGDVDAIVDAARARLSKIEPLTLTFGRPTPQSEGVAWALDTGAVAPVRHAIRDAIAAVWPTVPEPATGFMAHVSLAYADADTPAQPVADALSAVRIGPVDVRVDTAELIVLSRDHRMYQWAAAASVPLGASQPAAHADS